MYIREVKKQRSNSSKVFYQYTLAQAARVDGKVKQRAILYLGSDPLLKDKKNRDVILSILKAKIFNQPNLFPAKPSKPLLKLALSLYEKYCIKYGQEEQPKASIPPKPEKAEFHNVDIKGLIVEDVKTYGAENLCKQVLERFKIKDFLSSLSMTDKQVLKSLIAISARAIFSASEHKTAQILDINSGLLECFSYKEPITHKQLYEVTDKLYQHKEQIDNYLYNRITDMFDIDDKLVIFDISNTYFETGKRGSKKTTYSISKEKRNDCPLIVFTGVINSEGFIRHSRIYEGNKPDPATLSDMLKDLEKHSNPNSKQTIVIDAGIATEDNLKLIREKGYKYVAVSRRRLEEYSIDDTNQKIIELTNRKKEKVELAIFRPEGFNDTWMYVESQGKRKKEESINEKLKQRFEEDLLAIKKSLSKKGGTKEISKVWERIGRTKQKHNRVSSRYQIKVEEENSKAVEITWHQKKIKSKEDKEKGVYFIRTNYDNPNEKQLWHIYNTIREVESTFRSLKSDLNIRPVHHQKDERVEAHIYLTMLAYQLVNTIRYMLKKENINYDWRNVLRIMKTQTIQTIKLPTDKKVIHYRMPSKPILEAKQIYDATLCKDTQKAVKKFVVYH